MTTELPTVEHLRACLKTAKPGDMLMLTHKDTFISPERQKRTKVQYFVILESLRQSSACQESLLDAFVGSIESRYRKVLDFEILKVLSFSDQARDLEYSQILNATLGYFVGRFYTSSAAEFVKHKPTGVDANNV